VSGGVAIAAYRIVQEALTNVVKHARGARSEVVLRWSEGALELEVIDRGAVGGPEGTPGSDSLGSETEAGRGLAGMRERAAMYGGTFEAQPEPGRGFVVRARIPLGHASV
jgi:signal transduction histidine kinase